MLSSFGRACPAASREAYPIFIESFLAWAFNNSTFIIYDRAGLSAEGFRRQRQRHLLAGFGSGREARTAQCVWLLRWQMH
jgi:hypothetical protein